MVEESLILDAATVLLVVVLLVEKYRQGGDNQARFDDITMGLQVMAEELLKRTEKLLELRDFMPEISLVNQNPLASLGEFIKAIRGDMSGITDFNRPPKDEAGRYTESLTDGSTQEETNTTPKEGED